MVLPSPNDSLNVAASPSSARSSLSVSTSPGADSPPLYMMAAPASVRGVAPSNLALLALPGPVLEAVLACLGTRDVVNLACTCKALRGSCFPSCVAELKMPFFPAATHVDVGEVAAVAAKMRVGVAADAHLAALRVLLTQVTRFPRVRLASASFVGCGPHGRALLEACGLREETPGYLSASTPAGKARLSEGREMLELLVAQLELQGLEALLGRMLQPGSGTAAICRAPGLGAAESAGRRLVKLFCVLVVLFLILSRNRLARTVFVARRARAGRGAGRRCWTGTAGATRRCWAAWCWPTRCARTARRRWV